MIDRGAPGNAGEEGALVVDLLPAAMAMKFQEALLHSIFGIRAVEQDGIGDTKYEARLALYQRRKLRFFIPGQGVSAPVVAQLRCTSAKTERKRRVFGNLRGSCAADYARGNGIGTVSASNSGASDVLVTLPIVAIWPQARVRRYSLSCAM